MALPRTIIRLLRPYVIALIAVLIYVAYQHYLSIENDVIKQSNANLRTASTLIQEQLKSSVTNIASLNRSWQLDDAADANHHAVEMINNIENYNDILRYDSINNTALSELQIYAAQINHTQPQPIDMSAATRWTDMRFVPYHFQISNIYQSHTGRWVVAVRESHSTRKFQYIVEFDLWFMSQALIDLRTLNSGNVFVVDRATGQVILHPHPNRINEIASVYKYAIAGEIQQDDRSSPVSYYFADKPSYHFKADGQLPNHKLVGAIDYFYQGQPKLAVYNARNNLNWIYFSATSRENLLAHSYSLSLIGVLAITLLLIASVFQYLNRQLQIELTQLAHSTNLLEFKNQVNRLLSRFCSRHRVQLCLYHSDSHAFYSVGYQCEERAITIDQQYAKQLMNGKVAYIRNINHDRLASQVQVEKSFYRIPLLGQNGLLGVIFIESRTQTYTYLIQLLQTYIETSLSNVLFHEQVSLRDSITNQDNLFTLRDKINRFKEHDNVYLISIDVDDIKLINYQYGYACGDQLILELTDIINQHFPMSSTLSTARFSGDEFCVLFQADNQIHAYTLADKLRKSVAKHHFMFDTTRIQFTVCIGITAMHSSVDETVSASRKAIDKGKNKGKNLAIMSAVH